MAGAWQQSQERAPTKEMTRQHTDCSSIMYSTKFIKNRFIYGCIKHTGTLYRGSNQHNKPVNKLPKIGWASGILPTKLGHMWQDMGPKTITLLVEQELQVIHCYNIQWYTIHIGRYIQPDKCSQCYCTVTLTRPLYNSYAATLLQW